MRPAPRTPGPLRCFPSSHFSLRRAIGGARLVAAMLSSLFGARRHPPSSRSHPQERHVRRTIPFRALHPVRLRAAFRSDHEVIRSRCCTARPVGARPVLVSLRFAVDPLRVRRPPPSGWGLARARIAVSVLVRLRRAVSSVLGEIRRVFSSRRGSAPAARVPGYPFTRSPFASSVEPRSLSTCASNTRGLRRSRGSREIHRSSTAKPRNPQVTRGFTQPRAQRSAQPAVGHAVGMATTSAAACRRRRCIRTPRRQPRW